MRGEAHLPFYAELSQVFSTDKKAPAQVCLEAEKKHAFVPCGHLCVCEGCATAIMSGPAAERRCPVCRAEAAQQIRIFKDEDDNN